MRLLYLYIRSFGIFNNEHPVEINFAGDYKFSVYVDPKGHYKVTVEKGKALPKSFYSLRELHVKESVAAISAIVGGNGSGKSTIGTLLAIARGRSSRQCEMLMIWEKGGVWNLYTTISSFDHYDGLPVVAGGPKCEVVNEIGELQGSFDYVFFSPHFEPDNAFEQEFDSSSCYNLSTSALFFARPDKVLNKDLSRRDAINFIDRAYELEQNLWIGRFLQTRQKWKSREKKQIDLPSSASLVVYVENDVIKTCDDYFVERSHNESLLLDKHERDMAERFQRLRMRVIKFIMKPNVKDKGFAFKFLANYAKSFWRGIETGRRDDTGLDIYELLLESIEKIASGESEYGGVINDDVQAVLLRMGASLKDREPKIADKFSAAAKLLAILVRGEGLDGDGNLISRFCLYGRRSSKEPFLGESDLCNLFDLYSNAVFLYDFLEFKYTPAMSSGELVMLKLFSRLYWYLKPPLRGGDIGAHAPNKDVLVFLDEVETTLHPEWQRRIVLYLVWFFGKFAPKSKVHLIFATHSPILLSDIPATNCVFLERASEKDERPYSYVRSDVIDSKVDFNNTFMANIHDLYSLPFFLNNGCAGRFAEGKVGEALNPKSKLKEDDRQRIFSMIGDSIVRQVVKDTWRLRQSKRSVMHANSTEA